MAKKKIVDSGEKNYFSVAEAYRIYCVQLGMTLRAFYILVHRGMFQVVRIGKKRLIIARQSVIDYLEERGDEPVKKDFKEHWRESCHHLLGKVANIHDIAKLLGISHDLMNKLMREFLGKVKVKLEDSGKGFDFRLMDPMEMLIIMRDLDE